MSDAAASDDSDLRAIVHSGTPLTATALALAERLGSTGRDVLAAMVCGYEAAGRISGPVSPQFRDRGHHGSAMAIFAAAVCAGKLLKLDAAQLTRTIALAATSASGIIKAADTSVAREYHAGLVTRAGIDAALAAQKGFIAEETVLEGPTGFLKVYGGLDIAELGTPSGEDWDILTDMAVKLVPGGHPYHAFGEAAAKAAREGDIRVDQVEGIVVSRPGHPAQRAAAPAKPDRHGAQPALLHRRRGRRQVFRLGALHAGEDRRPGHPPADRQDYRRPAADRKRRALPPARDGDDPHYRRALPLRALCSCRTARRHSASTGRTSR
jgi:2-methylcitrate dehydratase PrpD